MAVYMCDDPCLFYYAGFFLLRWIPKRLGIIALNSSLCNGKLSMFGSSDSVKSFSEEFKQSDKMAFLLV